MGRGMGQGVQSPADLSHCRQGETSRRCDVTTGRRLGAMTGPGEKTGHRRGTPMGREETRWRTGRRSRRGGASHRPGMVTAGLGGSTLPRRTSGGTTSRPGGPVRHACRRAAAALAALAPALAPAPAAVAAAACRRSRAPPRLGAATAGSTRAVEKAAGGRPRHPGAPSRAPGGQRPSATSVAAPRAPHNRRRRRRPVPC